MAPVPEDLERLVEHATVVPKCGDVLIFPHGNMNGCYPNPLHEGSEVVKGEKCLIRTDLTYLAAPPKNGRKKKKSEKKDGTKDQKRRKIGGEE